MTQRSTEENPIRPRTLQLRGPFGRSLGWTILFLLLYLFAGEIFVRLEMVQALLGVPRLGTEHRHFEEQWYRFEKYAAARQSVDCVVLGDSTVMSDFAPEPFEEAYREQTREQISCYNYGVGALTMVGIATLAQLLKQEYAPRFIIVGVEALNFAVPEAEQGAADLRRVSFVRAKLGEFAPVGWLYEYAHLYRYLDNLSQFAQLSFQNDGLFPGEATTLDPASKGYFPVVEPNQFDVSKPPDADREHPYFEHYFGVMQSFQIYAENVEALDNILALDGPTTDIVLVEMPVPQTFYSFFGRGKEDYEMYIDAVREHTAQHNVPFWRLSNAEPLPSAVWFNYNHLNADGAPIFSEWLGERLGQAVK